MTEEDKNNKAALSDNSDCGLSVLEHLVSERQGVFDKPERSQREDLIMREALGLLKSSDAKWFDARGQGGPAPSDFGEHAPIPIDTICASAVLATEEKEVDDLPPLPDSLVEEMKAILESKKENDHG